MSGPTLKIAAALVNGGAPLDLSQYLDVTPGDGMDPYDPQFSQRVISHSLLRQGGVLALEDLKAKELQFPLKLYASTKTAVLQLVQQLNTIINADAAYATWQDYGASQATTFDLISGQFDIDYNFREEQQNWVAGKLRLFAQPLGHVAAARSYLTATITGPVQWLTTSATGVAAGSISYGASAGIDGDASGLLRTAVRAATFNNNPFTALTLTAMVAALPATSFTPLYTPGGSGPSLVNLTGTTSTATYAPLGGVVWGGPSGAMAAPTSLSTLAGQYRVLAVALASQAGSRLSLVANNQPIGGQIPNTAVSGRVATISTLGAWSLYDLGAYAWDASQYGMPAIQLVSLDATQPYTQVAGALIVPDNSFSLVTVPQTTMTALGVNAPATAYASVMFDGLVDRIAAQVVAPRGTVYSSFDVTSSARGGIPAWHTSAGNTPVLLTVALWGNVANGAPYALRPVSVSVDVLERTRFVFE